MATVNGTQYDDVIKSSGSSYSNGKKTGNLGNSTAGDDLISAGSGNDQNCRWRLGGSPYD